MSSSFSAASRCLYSATLSFIVNNLVTGNVSILLVSCALEEKTKKNSIARNP
jgi:hypothetical protein